MDNAYPVRYVLSQIVISVSVRRIHMLKNITIEEAKAILLREKMAPRIEKKSILDSLNLILAQDIVSNVNIPQFDRSPLDGYILRAEDTLGASKENPMVLEVIDSIHAGHVSQKTIGKNQAIRIMTGSKIPEGGDVVIRYEATEFTDKEVKLFEELKSGSNIVRTGEDVEIGQVVLKSGCKIGPAELGIMASLGKTIVDVYRPAKVAIIATGDELIDVDEELRDGKIRNSNSYTIYGLVKNLGGEPSIFKLCDDGIEDIKNSLAEALETNDMVITTGGVSVGDYDLVKDAFQELGGEVLFWRVQMKPGTPIAVGKYKGKLMFGLSGNPAAAYMNFENLVRDSILHFMGHSDTDFVRVESTLESDFTKVGGQDRYLRGYTYKKDGEYFTRLPDKHSSGVLSSMSGQNSIFLIPKHEGPYKKGDKIEVRMLNTIEVTE